MYTVASVIYGGVLGILLILVPLMGMAQDAKKMHRVSKVSQPIPVDANWNKSEWQEISAIDLKNFMGDRPEHFPAVKAKIAYDKHNLYLIWQVKDQYVKAVASKHQDPVYQDSCVEFFFSPNEWVDKGYFNLEMNCGGTMLFKHRPGTDKPFTEITTDDISKMQVAHTLPKTIEHEITEKLTWYLEYSIPFSMLAKYHDMERPTSNTIWRVNFYKIADKTSHPHWLTWSKVDYPTPRFHMPEFFGTLIFE